MDKGKFEHLQEREGFDVTECLQGYATSVDRQELPTPQQAQRGERFSGAFERMVHLENPDVFSVDGQVLMLEGFPYRYEIEMNFPAGVGRSSKSSLTGEYPFDLYMHPTLGFPDGIGRMYMAVLSQLLHPRKLENYLEVERYNINTPTWQQVVNPFSVLIKKDKGRSPDTILGLSTVFQHVEGSEGTYTLDCDLIAEYPGDIGIKRRFYTFFFQYLHFEDGHRYFKESQKRVYGTEKIEGRITPGQLSAATARAHERLALQSPYPGSFGSANK